MGSALCGLKYGSEGAPSRLYDLSQDPGEENNLIETADPEAAAALEKLEAVVKTFPGKDGAPQYEPLPPQPWDLKPDR